MKIVSMNHSKLICGALLAITLLTFKGFSQTPDPNFFIFLAFGQSNMEGYAAGTDQQIEKQDTINVPTRFQLLPAVDWPDHSRTKGTWTTAKPPLCRSGTGLCPCDYFGRTLVDSLPQNIKIGIVNVAVAGSAIEMFDKDKYQSYLAQSGTADWLRAIASQYGGNPGNPYARLVEMGKTAQKDGIIKGILMHQGESGAMSGGDTQWANEVKIVYNNLIKDLDLDSTKVPLLVGDFTNPNPSSPSKAYNIPKIIKNAYTISSKGAAVNSTNIHFSAAGYRTLGTNYADTMLKVFKKLGTGPTEVAPSKTSKITMAKNIEYNDGMISFEIPKDAYVSLKAFTLGGKEIAELANANYSMGKHTISFGRNVMPSGAIVLRMKAGSFSTSRTIVVGAR